VRSTDDRLKKLEGEEPERCAVCWERDAEPAYVGEFPEGGVSALPECYQPCPSCGWEPEIIQIIIKHTHEAAIL
jgi:hypothetical protein